MLRINKQECSNFYHAALLGLRALDRGQGRRFGENADANWKSFRGELHAGDRLNLLLRDASAVYPAAFSPRVVFGLSGLAQDEPFGPDWPPLSDVDALPMIQRSFDPSLSPVNLLLAAAAQWGIKPVKLAGALPPIAPATRLVASGVGAMLELLSRFASDKTLDLVDQIAWVTNSPAERHLFGLAAVLLENNRNLTFYQPNQLQAKVFSGRTAVLSEDAPAELRAAVLVAVKGA